MKSDIHTACVYRYVSAYFVCSLCTKHFERGHPVVYLYIHFIIIQGLSKRALQLWKRIEIYTEDIKLGVFCYILTVQNVVYVLCINFYTLSNL